MPSPQPMSALESLRTVEFRQTLRGYHIDDVDEYLERVAVEAEALQEQLRQAHERVRQATERITQLESSDRPAPPPADAESGADSLQRTLALAQKFVEQTEAEAQAQARSLVDEAQQRARTVLEEAEQRAESMATESEKRLRDEVTRLEGLRGKLAGDVDAISRHLEAERSRLRGALGEMLHWIDENMQPSATLKPTGAASAPPPGGPAPSPPGGDGRPREETAGTPTAQGQQNTPRPSGLHTLAHGNTANR